MKVAIVGSRTYQPLERVRQYVRALPADTIIISGGARGVDQAAEQEARKRGLEVQIFLPDWDAYGKAAGPMRNRRIVDACDLVVAFWDQKSSGTRNTIEQARSQGKTVLIIDAALPEEGAL